MANTGRPSFLKRQKEQQRLARAEAKRQARRARKQERLTDREETREDNMLTTAEALGLVPDEADETKN